MVVQGFELGIRGLEVGFGEYSLSVKFLWDHFYGRRCTDPQQDNGARRKLCL